jgi:hypothetical protein
VALKFQVFAHTWLHIFIQELFDLLAKYQYAPCLAAHTAVNNCFHSYNETRAPKVKFNGKVFIGNDESDIKAKL